MSNHEQHPLEPEFVGRVSSDIQMSDVWRVEGPAEETNTS